MGASPVRYFVYELRDPRPEFRHPETLVELAPDLDPRTFYVGKSKTTENRLRRHLNQATSGKHPCHRCHIIRQIADVGLVPELIVVASYDIEADALAGEMEHARRYPKSRLTNILEAGTTGWSHSPESRARMAERMAGFEMPAHVREAQRRAVTGRPKTTEEIERIRSAMKGRPLSPEHRAHVAAGVRSRDPEVYVRIGNTLRGRRWKLTPEGEEMVIAMRRAGHVQAEIGKAVGLSQSHTSQVILALIRAGRLPKPMSRAERLAKAAAIYNAGGGADDVVKALDLGARSSAYLMLKAAERGGLIPSRTPRPYLALVEARDNPESTRAPRTATGRLRGGRDARGSLDGIATLNDSTRPQNGRPRSPKPSQGAI